MSKPVKRWTIDVSEFETVTVVRASTYDTLQARCEELEAALEEARGLLEKYLDSPSDEIDDAYEGEATYHDGTKQKVMLTPKGWLDHEARAYLGKVVKDK